MMKVELTVLNMSTRTDFLFPLIQERSVSVTSESMCTKYWSTACQACPGKSVVRLTDQLNMIIAVHWDVKQQTEQTNKSTRTVHLIIAVILHCIYEPRHGISNNVVCATRKASDQPAHMRSLIRAFASCLHII